MFFLNRSPFRPGWFAISVLAFVAVSFAQPNADSRPFLRGRVLLKLRPEMSDQQVQGWLSQFRARSAHPIPQIGVHVVELPEGADEHAFTRAFQGHPEVEFAELDRLVAPGALIPNDAYYPQQWHLPKIGAPAAWDSSSGSSAVVIAILDTGVDASHEDLASKIVPGWNVYDNNSDSRDVYGHGTKVAGTAAALTNNAIGAAAVAWGCRIMPIRISDTSGWATFSAAASGLTWAADHGARVANLSYAMSDSSTVTSAARYFRGKGGLVTSSSGNDGAFLSFPDNPEIVTVGATDSSDLLYSWSNRGDPIDVVAPGCNAATTLRGGGYGSGCGTSHSAPITAGVIALLFSASPGLTAAEAEKILEANTDDLGSAGWDSSFGWGRVNAAKAVLASLGSQSPDAVAPSVTITSPLDGATASGTIQVSGSATDNVAVTKVEFYVDGSLAASTNSATFSFSWNTTTVANGNHTLAVKAYDGASNSGSASVTVNAQNTAAPDTQAPSVTITSPVNGTSVRKTVRIRVSASDNGAVTQVLIYIDGVMVSSDTVVPYEYSWDARRASAGSHVITAKASDAAGNTGSAPPVTVYR